MKELCCVCVYRGGVEWGREERLDLKKKLKFKEWIRILWANVTDTLKPKLTKILRKMEEITQHASEEEEGEYKGGCSYAWKTSNTSDWSPGENSKKEPEVVWLHGRNWEHHRIQKAWILTMSVFTHWYCPRKIPKPSFACSLHNTGLWKPAIKSAGLFAPVLGLQTALSSCPHLLFLHVCVLTSPLYKGCGSQWTRTCPADLVPLNFLVCKEGFIWVSCLGFQHELVGDTIPTMINGNSNNYY